jgi:CRP/FNR family cyclic AMP-dependent transcriptional regulator
MKKNLSDIHCFDSPWVDNDSSSMIDSLLIKLGSPRFFQPGQIIYLQESYTNDLYYIGDGKVKIYVLSEDGTEKILAFQEKGTLFGVSSAFDGGPYRETAEAVLPSTIYVINIFRILQAMERNPSIASCIINACGRRIKLLTAQLEALSFLSVHARIAQILAKAILSHGQQTERGKKLEIHLTHQELADIVAAERSTVTRVLNEFRKMGIVDKNKWDLFVVDEQKLEKIAEGKVV